MAWRLDGDGSGPVMAKLHCTTRMVALLSRPSGLSEAEWSSFLEAVRSIGDVLSVKDDVALIESKDGFPGEFDWELAESAARLAAFVGKLIDLVGGLTNDRSRTISKDL